MSLTMAYNDRQYNLPEEYVSIGNLGAVHALRGEINAVFDDDATPQPGDFLFVDIDSTMIPYQIETLRPKGQDQWLVKFYDLDSVEAAEALRGHELYADAMSYKDYSAAFYDDDEDGNVYISDVEGFTVRDAVTGEILGDVVGYDDSTLNAILFVDRPGDEKSGRLMIPFVDEFILSVDVADREIEVSLPPDFADIFS